MKKILVLLMGGLLFACLAGSAMAASSCLRDQFNADICNKDILLKLNQPYNIHFVVLMYSPSDVGTHSYQFNVTPWPNTNGNTVGDPTDVSITGPSTFTLPAGQDNYTDPNPITVTVNKEVVDSQGAPAKYKITVGDTNFILTSTSVNVSVPEFPTIALPVAGILGLIFVFGRKKGDL